MKLSEFKMSLSHDSAPDISPSLLALWHDHKGNWVAAHNVAQEINTPEGSWVHAYLHRKEGDISNAHYWYRMAKRKMPVTTLEQEWEDIVATLIEDHSTSGSLS